MNELRIIKQSYQNFWRYKRDYLKASLLFQVIRLLIISPLLAFFVRGILRQTTFGGITNTTLGALLRTPKALLFISIMAIVFLFFIFFEFGLYFLYADGHGFRELKFRYSLRQLFNKLKYFISFQVILFLIYFILIVPIASIGLEGTLLDGLYIPHFITDELMNSLSGKILYLAVLSLLFYLSVRLVFSIPFFVFNPRSTIFSGIRQSYQFSKHKFFKIIFVLGGILLVHTLLSGGLIFALISPVVWAESQQLIGAPLLAAVMMSLLEVFTFLNFSALQALFAEGTVLLMKDGQPVIKRPINKRHLSSGLKKILILPVTAVALISVGANLYYLTRTVYTAQTIIISHRGETSHAVENTVEALINAQKAGADMTEVDIQRTKDGEFVLYHDTSLGRLANSSKKIEQLTLKEVEALTLKSGGNIGKIPTLKEVLQLANTNEMTYLLEAKFDYDAKGKNVKDFLAILEEYDPLHRHQVQGLNQRLIEKIETEEPLIKTGLIIAFQYGNLPETPVDFLVIEEFSFSEKSLSAAHAIDKQLYIWTINQESLMKRYMSKGADGLITNHPATALKIKNKLTENYTLTDKIKKSFNW